MDGNRVSTDSVPARFMPSPCHRYHTTRATH